MREPPDRVRNRVRRQGRGKTCGVVSFGHSRHGAGKNGIALHAFRSSLERDHMG